MTITTQKTSASRIAELDQNNLKFGNMYADHMLECDYVNGTWGEPKIVPYANLSLSPSTTFMHYGQAFFEGIKAYKNKNGEIKIFRPEANFERFNKSADRMAMPHVSQELFLEGMRQLIELDKNWVPNIEGSSLYIRPFMLGTDEFIGVKPAEKFKFLIITSPAGAYYPEPIKIYVHDKYVRAFPGGTGMAKSAGNYGATMMPMVEVRKMGYDQILWTDGFEHKFVQECGTMNVFFVIDNVVITPPLTEGTILEGVTRNSIIKLLQARNIKVEERALGMNEIMEAHINGKLQEAFGAGTAAVVAPIKLLHYENVDLPLPAPHANSITETVKKELADIRYGNIEDKYNWMYSVC